MLKKLILLDRDGVINYDSNDYIKSPDEWQPIPGSIEAIAKLSKAGATVVIVTNQSGIARGLFTLETLEAIHQKMRDAVAKAGGEIAKIYFCPHHPEDHCACRKPKLGMFEKIAQDFSVDLREVIYVGDQASDLEAGRKIGCTFLLVKTGKGEKTLEKYPTEIAAAHIPVFENLAAAVELILSGQTAA